MSDMIEFKVYGASDDLIEITGDIREELTANYGEPSYLIFQNGLILKVEYTKRGEWVIDTLNCPTRCTVELNELPNTEFNDYSQVATVKTDQNVEYVIQGTDIKTF